MQTRYIILMGSILLGLAAIEGMAYWWMNPAPTGMLQAKLVYSPKKPSQSGELGDKSGEDRSNVSPEVHTITPLPEVVSSTLAILHCSTGVVARLDQANGVVIHLAFFEWNSVDSTSVLEAYKHLPDECMGSIGMELLEKLPPRFYVVGGEKLLFDHTVFRDPVGRVIHAFKGTWVSGASNLIGTSFRGGADQWRAIRFKAGLYRFRPAYARVAQGAVRGISDPQLAWEAFEKAMLGDLSMQ